MDLAHATRAAQDEHPDMTRESSSNQPRPANMGHMKEGPAAL